MASVVSGGEGGGVEGGGGVGGGGEMVLVDGRIGSPSDEQEGLPTRHKREEALKKRASAPSVRKVGGPICNRRAAAPKAPDMNASQNEKKADEPRRRTQTNPCLDEYS